MKHLLCLPLLVIFMGCAPLFNLGREPLKTVIVREPERWWTWNRILILDVSGLITSGKTDEIFREGTSLVEDVHEALRRARKDPTIKGVIVRIDSPGGEVTASDIIHREIQRYAEETEVPVVAELMGLATSGGYYIASATDRIYAHPTSVTGSIGVLLLTINVEGLENLIGVQIGAITSAQHKDIMSPFRAMLPEERQIMQGIIDDLYGRFVDVVAANRADHQMTPARVRALADGRVFTARQALEAGLIDEIAYLPEVIEAVKDEAGIRDAEIITYKRGGRSSSEYGLYSRAGAPAPQVNVNLIDRSVLSGGLEPGFYYLWRPGGL